MASLFRLLSGLLVALAGVMALPVATAGAQQSDCSAYPSAATAQFALEQAPALAPALDPDGNGTACDHAGTSGNTTPVPGGLQLPGEAAETPVSNIPAGATIDVIDQQPADTTTTTTAPPAATQAPATQQGGVLDGRLGGSQTAFAAAHGAPIDVVPSESSDAVTLRAYTPPPTSFDLYTIDLNDQVAVVVVVAESSWDTQQAADIIAEYLPADVTDLGAAEALADGTRLIPTYSDDLATGVSADSMARAGIPGVPGDLYLLLFLDDAGGIEEIEIGLGNGDDLREDAQPGA